jgi:conjugative transfer region protein (TIGR03748 family)
MNNSHISNKQNIKHSAFSLLIGVLAIFVTASSALAKSSSTDIGRYMTVIDKPKNAQINLLSQTIEVRFPLDVQNIGEAMNYLLRLSGYSLTDQNKMNCALKETLKKPLPAVDRDFGPMSLKDGLTTLAGPAFILIQDTLNRTVDFRVKPAFIKEAPRKQISTVVLKK